MGRKIGCLLSREFSQSLGEILTQFRLQGSVSRKLAGMCDIVSIQDLHFQN